MSVSLSFDGFNPGFISSLARNPGFQRLRRRSFLPKNGYPIVMHPSYPSHCRSTASDPDFRLSRGRRLRRRIYCLARSESCASVREFRIRILSGCVRGFACPRTGAQAPTNVLSVTFSIQGLRTPQNRSKVLFVAYAMRRKHSWRIRLAAYGARLERVLG